MAQGIRFNGQIPARIIKTKIKVSENPSAWGKNQRGTTHVQTASDR